MVRKLSDFRRADDSDNFEYFLEYGTVNSSSQKPAILLIGGAEGGINELSTKHGNNLYGYKIVKILLFLCNKTIIR